MRSRLSSISSPMCSSPSPEPYPFATAILYIVPPVTGSPAFWLRNDLHFFSQTPSSYLGEVFDHSTQSPIGFPSCLRAIPVRSQTS